MVVLTPSLQSFKKTASVSLFVHIASRALGLLGSILFLRLFSTEIVGGFTLVAASAQSLSSLARFGTDYTYQVTACALPPSQRGGLQRQFLVWNAGFSAVAALVAWPLMSQSLLPLGITSWIIFLVIAYLFVESYVDVPWELILANRNYGQVFIRHLQVAFSKAVLPLAFGLFFGWCGVLFGLLLSSLLNMAVALLGVSRFPPAGGEPLPVWRFLRGGLPFYIVPLVQQMVFWPALLRLGNSNGLVGVGLIKVAQLMVQFVGVVPTALAPILFVESAHGNSESELRLLNVLRGVLTIGVSIFTLYSLFDTNVLPYLFGSSYDAAVLPARAMLLAAVCSGISQVFQQQAFRGKLLVQLSILQIVVLLILAPIGISWWLPRWGAEGYAWLTLAVAVTTLLSFFAWDPQGLLRRRENLLPGIALLVNLPLAFTVPQGPLAFAFPIIVFGLLIRSNKNLLLQFLPPIPWQR